jgi:hypothetical protein
MKEIPALARVALWGPVGLRRPATIAIPAVDVKLAKRRSGLLPKMVNQGCTRQSTNERGDRVDKVQYSLSILVDDTSLSK